jgi:putative tricarboxylic transport membrane protein
MTERESARAPEPARPPVDRHTMLATAAFGALMLVAAVLVIVDALRLPAMSAVVGPAAVPLPIGVLLGVVGAGLLVEARAKAGRATTNGTAGRAWQPRAGLRVLGLVAALVGFAVLLPVLGYVVTSTGLFVAAALLLGAPRDWRVFAWGWALAAVVFLIFDRLIGLTLPAGPWGF